MTPESQALLDELAMRWAIAPDYVDIFGHRHVTSNETKRAILAAMHVEAGTDEDVQRELAAWDEHVWRRPSDPVLVAPEASLPARWPFRLPLENGEQTLTISWEARDESGAVCAQGTAGPGLPVTGFRTIDGARHLQVELPLPSLPIGYYDLTAYEPGSGVTGTMRLIVVPPRCYVPAAIEHGGRTWGVALQLYSLRSAANWGVGDFGDLQSFVQWAGGELGAGMVGLNPLHALRNTRPYHISPYSPDSRLFLNGVYIDLEAVPECATGGAIRTLLDASAFRARRERARAAAFVDYDQIYQDKLEVLRACYAQFEREHLDAGPPLRGRTPRGAAFVDYLAQEGEPLERYAVFQALEGQFRASAATWLDWPPAYRHPSSPAVAEFVQTRRADVRFHQYVQWIAAEQLARSADRAGALGMAVGLYYDLALGSDRTGADAWAFQDCLALDADCGAPPDAFAPEGQNWGLPPVNPRRLREDAYRMYVEMLRHMLRHGGALRIDHVMALFRLFWIPRGMPASAGTYVSYPAQDLLGILALESVRHRAAIVGEDLGTVPDYVRETLGAWRVLSYRVSYFERRDDGEWKRPEAYPEQALAVVSTHDLPTLAGFWSGRDIETRMKLGLIPDERAIQAAWAERRHDKARMVRALQAEGLLAGGPAEPWIDTPDLPRDVWRGVHVYLARTPAAMMLANLDDLIGEPEQANLPGTVDTHPNWSRKASLSLDDLRRDSRPHELAAAIGPLRRGRAS